MHDADPARVLIAHRSTAIRRILRLNLESEGLLTFEAASVADCIARLHAWPPAAVVLDARLLAGGDTASALTALLRDSAIPVLVLSTEPADLGIARSLGGAPFCNRPDEVERITAAVRTLLVGDGLPTLV